MTDKKILHTVSISTVVVLLFALILPHSTTGRIITAILLVPLSVIAYFFIKKRSIPSLNSKQILMIMTTVGASYVMLYYLSGLSFGFVKSIYGFNVSTIFEYVVPITAVIAATELLRYVFLSQNDKLTDVLTYVSCVLAEVLICSTILAITSFARFMDFVGMSLFPAISANLLYNYLAKRYGMFPNLAYRLITTLHIYLIPIESRISDSLLALANLLLPIAIFLFIDSLYEKKTKYALVKKSPITTIISAVAVVIMISAIMLISNHFKYGTLVIATESMTGELNKGDAAIFEKYDDQIINEGQVIVFEKDGSMIIHRVDDIKRIDGVTQYYTKGDANDFTDAGFRTDANIIGLVNFKIPYVGYPTIWMRNLFDR